MGIINNRAATSERLVGILQDTYASPSGVKLSELSPTAKESIYIFAAVGAAAVVAAGAAAYLHLRNLESDHLPENLQFHQEREEASEKQAEEDRIARLEARQANRQNHKTRIGGFLGQNTRS